MEGPYILLKVFPFAAAVVNELLQYTMALPGSIFKALYTKF